MSLANSKFAVLDKMINREQLMIRTIETDTVKKLSFKDLRSFEVLFRQYYQMLCSYAFRFVNDTDTAEEIVQDLFYKLWEKRDELQINTSVKSYLFSAVHNRCLKYIEHRNVETKYKNYYLLHESEIDNETQNASDIQELQGIIDKTLDSLPDKCSRVFKLSRFEGLKYHEIAEKLSISVKTVEANMGKALKMLRKNLKNYVEIA
jgi:RNA polymerase sigma-70 factor (ECF subfamily)